MPVRVGTLIAGLGVFKIAVGLGVYRAEVRRIVLAGVLATVTDQSIAAALLWFLFAGGLLVLLGLVVAELERDQRHPIPRALAPGLAILGISACILMPENGAWLLLPIAGVAWHRSRRAASAAAN